MLVDLACMDRPREWRTIIKISPADSIDLFSGLRIRMNGPGICHNPVECQDSATLYFAHPYQPDFLHVTRFQ